MKGIKILSLILAALTLALASCGESGGGGVSAPSNGDAAQNGAAETEPAETAPETLPSSLPEMDLGGFTLTLYRSGNSFQEKGVWSEELTGDIVEDDIYNRNKYVEETCGCKIELLETESQHASFDMAKYVAAGDDTVDVVLDGGQFISQNAASFLNLNGLKYFDFAQPWWNQDFNNGITIGGKLFFTIGCYQISALQGVRHIIFNKTVAENYGINAQGYYDLVHGGKWVIDVMIEDAQKVKSDLNGDGVYNSDDLWGVVGENYDAWTLALGCGFRCAEKDADDMPVITFGSERNNSVMDKVMQIAGNQETTIFAQRMKGVSDVWGTVSAMKKRNNCWLFTIGGLGNAQRDMTDDYGVLPTPKFDEKQERYYHDASLGNSPTTGVPVSASDPDTVSYILEAICWSSYYQVLPDFYDNYLNTKLARDEESVEMLQLVHSTLYYDLGALYNWGDMRMIIENMSNKPENTLQTNFAKAEKKINKDMEKTLATFEG
ncbi:MAG: hypothetical protein K6D94_03590 [Clostridiales bacterium]|nr:hypothetical protein [Clostridiales bacterium]